MLKDLNSKRNYIYVFILVVIAILLLIPNISYGQNYVVSLDAGHSEAENHNADVAWFESLSGEKWNNALYGTSANYDNYYKDITEGTLTKHVVMYMRSYLAQYSNITVVVAPRTGNDYRKQRPLYAKTKNADVHVSIHFDSDDGEGVGSGTSVLYRTGSENLAKIILENAVDKIGLPNGGISKRDDLSIIQDKYTMGDIQNVVLEAAFYDEDYDFVSNEQNLKIVAQGAVAGILEYLGVEDVGYPEIPDYDDTSTETEKEEEDTSGPILDAVIAVCNTFIDAVNSLQAMVLKSGYGLRNVMVGKNLASKFEAQSDNGKVDIINDKTSENSKSRNVVWYYDKDGNESYSGEENDEEENGIDELILQVEASSEASDVSWPSQIAFSQAEGDYEEYFTSEGNVSGIDEEDDDGTVKVEGEETAYFINATKYKSLYSYPQIGISPEQIFSGEIDLLNADFFNTEGVQSDSVYMVIRNIVIYWFRALRYLGLAVLLVVLVYSGIKIMMSSVAKNKSKYKQGIVNWVVAIFLMFLLPYIMSFTFYVTGQLIKLMKPDDTSITIYSYDALANNDGLISNIAEIPFLSSIISTIDQYMLGNGWHAQSFTYTKIKTNLMGLVRFQVQTRNSAKKIGYFIMYLMLTILTFRFTIMYIKRMINTAFLTMISPLIVMMYPIDKIGDGKSQSFEAWLKEYIFNALLQPVHMLMYFIFVTSAMNFAAENIFYVLVVLGFMSEAEKIFKSIFGFDRAPSERMGSLATTAMKLSALTNTVSTVRNVLNTTTKSSEATKFNQKSKKYGLDDVNFDRISDGVIQSGNNIRQISAQDIADLKSSFVPDDWNEYNSLVAGGLSEEDAGYVMFAQKEFSDSEKLRFKTYNKKLNAKDATIAVMLERGYTEDEKKLFNDLIMNQGMSIPEAVKSIEARRESPEIYANPSVDDSYLIPANKSKTGIVQRRFTAPKGYLTALKDIARENRQNRKFKLNSMGINKGRTIIRGVSKVGVGLGMYAFGRPLAAMATTLQAAYSATDGKYSVAEAVATYGGTVAGVGGAILKVGNKFENLYSEFEKTKLGKDDYKKRERARKFATEENFKKFQEKYGEMGDKKLFSEWNRALEYASEGIDNVKDQMRGMEFADSLVEEQFRVKYGDDTNRISQRANELRNNPPSGITSKQLKGLTDEDIIRISLRAPKDKLVIDALLGEKALEATLGKGFVNLPKSKQEKEIRDKVSNDADVAGMMAVIELVKRMNKAQHSQKDRLNNLKAEYKKMEKEKKASLASREERLDNIEKEIKHAVDSEHLSSYENIREWQMTILVLRSLKQSGGSLDRQNLRQEFEKYKDKWGITKSEEALKKVKENLQTAGCKLDGDNITLGSDITEEKIYKIMRQKFVDKWDK